MRVFESDLMDLCVRPYRLSDQAAVIAIWDACGLVRPWNDPKKDIARKLAIQPEMFLVGVAGERVVATVMAGYDGHRGWAYYLGVAPGDQGLSYGRTLMLETERLLLAKGCPKISLQVRTSNARVVEFYKKLGYVVDETVSLGKRLIAD